MPLLPPEMYQQRRIIKELLQQCLQRCEHDILTQSDIRDINSLWSKRDWLYSTDYSQASNILNMFLNRHGRIQTGGFDFTFTQTNSFGINGNEWSLHISNLALLMIICLIFGLCRWDALVPGASAAAILFFLESLEQCLQRCEHDILTQADIEEIHSLWSKRDWFYLTNYSEVYNIPKMFLNGHGRIQTGGFDFTFTQTNSFDINGKGWSLHISNLALLMIICLIFGAFLWVALVPGASAASIALGPFSLNCCVM